MEQITLSEKQFRDLAGAHSITTPLDSWELQETPTFYRLLDKSGHWYRFRLNRKTGVISSLSNGSWVKVAEWNERN